jgi:hypothetical protein
VESLDPGPGPADITYLFGNKSKRLNQVNVAWGEDAPNKPSGANALVAAGTRLVRYFLEFSWRKDTARVGIPVGENTVVLFAGEDEKKGVVRLVFDGIKISDESRRVSDTVCRPKGATETGHQLHC